MLQAILRVNKCFGMGVTSGARDGSAPELNPRWAHRRTNTHPEVRHVPQLLHSEGCLIAGKTLQSQHCQRVFSNHSTRPATYSLTIQVAHVSIRFYNAPSWKSSAA